MRSDALPYRISPPFLRYSIACILSLFLYSSHSLFGQSRYTFQQLDNSSGLSSSCLNDIFSDSENLLWLGTWDGLNVYDGSSFHVFNYSQQSDPKKNIGSNVIYQMAEDTSKLIWIATIEGISRYERNTGNFQHYFYGNKDSLGSSKSYLLAVGKRNGQVYAAPKFSQALFYFDDKTNVFRKCDFKGQDPGIIIKLLFDIDGRLIILNNKGEAHIYKSHAGAFLKDAVIKNDEPISNIFLVNNIIFYSTSGRNLYALDRGHNHIFKTKLPFPVRAMAYYKEHYVLAWSSKGFGEYDENFTPQFTIASEMPAMSHMRITSLRPMGQNMLWVGTDGNGVIQITVNHHSFGLVGKWLNGEAINIPIRAFNEVSGDLWVGTKGNGIIKIKEFGTPNASSSSIHFSTSSTALSDARVYTIEKNKTGYVYVGSDAEGITLYDADNNQWYAWNMIENSSRYPSFSLVHSILIDKDSSLWLGLEAYGLAHLKIIKNNMGQPSIQYLYQYAHTGNNLGPANNAIFALAEGSAGQILIGCRYGGLSIFDKKNKVFRTFTASYSEGLSNNDVLSLYKDSKQRVWIGTSYGMNVIDLADLDLSKPAFKRITTENGLPNNTVHGITEDAAGYIWASTNKGLVRISPLSFEIVRFRQSDGLQSDEFSDGAIWKDEKGQVFFGGVHGFNYFFPDSIKTNQPLSNLMVSDFQLAGNSLTKNVFKVVPAGGDYKPDVFSISRDGNYFEMMVKAINFSNTEKCQYAYTLEGNHNEWRYVGEDGKISYNNILPGNYNLKVKWSNGDGKWTNEVVLMQLNVRQYFWQTLPAFLLYGFVIFTAWYVFYIYRKDQAEMNNRLYLEQQLRLKDEEIHKGQQQFFTNITHELQTPLTLILGGLDRFMHKNKDNKNVSDKQFISLVHQQASRLSYLAHQLLEFRRAEEGFVKNHYTLFNVSNLLENIAALFQRHEENKNLEFTVKIEPGIELWTDKDKLEKIVFNILSNAFKHTGSNEKVLLEVYTDNEQHLLKIKVANSGVKLREEDVERIFDKFFIAEEKGGTKLSTGIGLAFTRELVNLLNGSIDVSCQQGWITFNLSLQSDFIPEQDEIANTSATNAEMPSTMIRSVADNSYEQEQTMEVINKKALVDKLEYQDKKSILIVDDEPAIRFLLKDILSEHYIIYEAENGKKALEIVKNMVPGLIISDVMMQDMDGLELCSIIKNIPETCQIPFILLTAKGAIEQKIEGYDAGADAYIPKPFNIDHLLVRVRKLLEYRQKLHRLFSEDNAMSHISEEGMKEEDRELLTRIHKLVESRIDDTSLDATFLEKELALSKMQLYRKLKSLSDMTPNELIKFIRLQKAALLLKTTRLSVAEIFYGTGFNHRSYFFREFKKMYNCSPNEYRQQHQVPFD